MRIIVNLILALAIAASMWACKAKKNAISHTSAETIMMNDSLHASAEADAVELQTWVLCEAELTGLSIEFSGTEGLLPDSRASPAKIRAEGASVRFESSHDSKMSHARTDSLATHNKQASNDDEITEISKEAAGGSHPWLWLALGALAATALIIGVMVKLDYRK